MKSYLSCIVLFACVSWSIAQNTFPGQIGVGIGLSQWNKPFVDIVKNSRGFEGINGSDLQTDELGWPKENARLVLLEAWPVAEWLNDIDDPDEYHTDLSGTYSGSLKGQATISPVAGDFSLSNFNYDASTNTTTFNLNISQGANGLVILEFSNTRRTPSSPMNSGFTDLRVIRPGYPANTLEVYNQTFLDALNSACFSTIRFMDFTETNNSNPEYPAVSEWDDRKKIDAASYRKIEDDALPGVPWEYVVELGNTLEKDIWINVPVAATDDYIGNLAEMIKTKLNPNLRVYVEYSNEVWNWLFSQSQWNLAQAETLGLSYIEAYAKRTAEIAMIFKEVFGVAAINDRVRVVNCWQIGWWPPNVQYNQQMEYINTHFRSPKDLIYGLGVAPYFNCGDACETGSVEEILEAFIESSDASKESRRLVREVAEQWELPGGMLAYEGGSDTGGGSTVNVANRIRAERDAEMEDIMIHDLKENWFSVGGGLFMYLSLASNYNRYGSWGLTDEVANPDRNFKFKAVRKLLGNCNLTKTKQEIQKETVLLHQNVPNPWTSGTNISYSIEQSNFVQLSIFNLMGIEVAKLVSERQEPGVHTVRLDGQSLTQGTYLYKLQVGDQQFTKKFLYLGD